MAAQTTMLQDPLPAAPNRASLPPILDITDEKAGAVRIAYLDSPCADSYRNRAMPILLDIVVVVRGSQFSHPKVLGLSKAIRAKMPKKSHTRLAYSRFFEPVSVESRLSDPDQTCSVC